MIIFLYTYIQFSSQRNIELYAFLWPCSLNSKGIELLEYCKSIEVFAIASKISYIVILPDAGLSRQYFLSAIIFLWQDISPNSPIARKTNKFSKEIESHQRNVLWTAREYWQRVIILLSSQKISKLSLATRRQLASAIIASSTGLRWFTCNSSFEILLNL